MNKKEQLLQFHFEQEEYIKQNAEKLRSQGFVKEYKDVYPDIYKRIHSQKGVSYIRGSVPIKLLALLYDTVIVYIPPLSKKQLEQRYGLKWEEFIKLCQQNIVIPIIGNTINYIAAHFNALFMLPNPPYSLWARGIGLLDVFGMSDTLSVAKEVLPVDKIADDSTIFQRWKKRTQLSDDSLIRQKIMDDVSVLYADLCIFGCKQEAESLTCLPPRELYNSLRIMNEIRTYPVLFGLESQANYDSDKLKTISKIGIKQSNFQPAIVPKEELEILFEGIGINADNIEVEDIITYHTDGLGKKLRAALSYFNSYCDDKIQKSERLDMTEVYTRAEAFQKDLKTALRDLDNSKYAKIDKTYNTLTNIFKIGTVAIGAALAFNEDTSQTLSILSVVGTASSLIGALPEEIAELITKLATRGLESKFVSNMWAAKKIVGDKK